MDLSIRVDGILTGSFINVRPPYRLNSFDGSWVRLPKWTTSDLGAGTVHFVASYVKEAHRES
jgi:hypothetical protein